MTSIAYVERMLGRDLRPAERIIDILRLNAALNRAKDDLDRAIRAEMVRATRRWLRTSPSWRPRVPHMTVTPTMRRILCDLERLGREEARRELDRVGVPVRAHVARNPDPRVSGLGEAFDTIAAGLPDLAVR